MSLCLGLNIRSLLAKGTAWDKLVLGLLGLDEIGFVWGLLGLFTFFFFFKFFTNFLFNVVVEFEDDSFQAREDEFGA